MCPVVSFSIFGHAVTLNIDLLTPKLNHFISAQRTLLTKVWCKSIHAHHKYCRNNMWTLDTHRMHRQHKNTMTPVLLNGGKSIKKLSIHTCARTVLTATLHK